MRKILIYTYLLFISSLHSQSNSKIYELSSYHEILDNTQSILHGMLYHEDNIYLHVEHLCDSDTTDNRRAFCTGIYKIDSEGNVINSIVLDSLFANGFKKMKVISNQIHVSGQKHGVENNFINEVQILSSDLVLQQVLRYPSNNNQIIENHGLVHLDSCIYFYGKIGSSSGTSLSHIQKINSNFELVDEFRYSKGLSFNDCLDLQPTADGNLIYINRWSDGVGAQPSGAQIMVIDTDGNTLDSLNIDDNHPYTDVGRSFLLSSSGDAYFFSSKDLSDENLPTNGSIYKYDKSLDTFLWRAEMPFNNFTNARQYEALNMIEAKNGDILVCGTVFDEGPDGPIANGYDHTWNGFLTRLDTDGNILWLRLYKTDNNYPLVPKSEYGKFLNSTIWNIHELEDGRIVTGGTSYHTGQQNTVIRPAGETEFYVWLMTVNANGCVDGEECDEVIILDGENRPKDGYLPIITNKQTWIERNTGDLTAIVPLQYTYSEDSVSQITNYYFERIQTYQENGTGTFVEGYYREQEGKVYQKFEGNFNEEVIFDMTLLKGDTIRIDGQLIEAVNVDTIEFNDNIGRKRIEMKCIENSFNDTTWYWVEGIGELSHIDYCKLNTDILYFMTCVLNQDGERIYSAITDDENCWLTVNTDDIYHEQFSIFPNPAQEVIQIDIASDIQKLEIYNTEGKLIGTSFASNSIDLRKIPNGIYYLKVTTNEGIGVQSFVKH